MSKARLKRMWQMCLGANLVIVITGFITGNITGNYGLFLYIAGIGMALEFILPSILVALSNDNYDDQRNK